MRITNLLEYFYNEYWEVLAHKKHICPNRPGSNNPRSVTTTSTNTKPTFYSKKPGVQNQKF